jgi:hypothetical protein
MTRPLPRYLRLGALGAAMRRSVILRPNRTHDSHRRRCGLRTGVDPFRHGSRRVPHLPLVHTARGSDFTPTFEFRTKTLPVRRDGSPTTIEISFSTPLHAPSIHTLRRGGDTNVEVYLEDQGGWTQTGGTLRAMEGAFNDDSPSHSVTESGEVDATLSQLPHPVSRLPDLHISGH